MESVEALSQMSWSSFHGTILADETEFMSQLLGGYPFVNVQDRDDCIGFLGAFWSGHEATNMVMGDNDSNYHCSETFNSSFNSSKQGKSNENY